jgi:Protein of unknown function (DUF3352)
MTIISIIQPQRRRYILQLTLLSVFVLIATIDVSAQTRHTPMPKRQTSEPVPGFIAPDFSKYPGLLDEFGKMFQRFQREVQLPPERTQSHLLSLMPASTMSYFAAANYGESVHQVLTIFQQEMAESSVLRQWWQESPMAKDGPKLEKALGKAYRVSEFLGDEVVITGELQGGEPKLLVVAEVKKPRLAQYLAEVVKEINGSTEPGIVVVEPQQLATYRQEHAGKSLVVLVRADYVVAATDLNALRSFNARLGTATGEFGATPFGQRVSQAYGGGVTAVGAVDFEKMISRLPFNTAQDRKTLEQSGFDNVKYAIWDHKTVADRSLSEAELSFNGPRHGVAAWLDTPSPMGSLEFVSPNAVMVAAVQLKNPAQIFDEIKELATVSNPRAFASFDQMQSGLGINLRDEVFGQLTGEVTLAVDNLTPPVPEWKAILRVNDADRLQQALDRLVRTMPFRSEQYEQQGITYHVIRIPSPRGNSGFAYAFVEGYLIVASTPAAVAKAAQIHRSGESLAKSSQFRAALPPGHDSGMSALFYQDPIAMAALQMQRLAPEMAKSITSISGKRAGGLVCLYADDDAIREASTSAGVDAGTILVVAAIAIPNLLRSRMAANEASAVGSLRIVNTAQVTYAASDSDRGFAPDLATLGPGVAGGEDQSGEHAALIDASLAGPACTVGKWCTKSGYRFSIRSTCMFGGCKEYVAVATPVQSSTGTKSFCSTSDGVIRMKLGLALTLVPSVSECKSWKALQ